MQHPCNSLPPFLTGPTWNMQAPSFPARENKQVSSVIAIKLGIKSRSMKTKLKRRHKIWPGIKRGHIVFYIIETMWCPVDATFKH